MNKDNYKKALDNIHASQELKEKTFDKINKEMPKRKVIPFKKMLTACAVITIIFSVATIYFNKSDKNKQVPINENKTLTIAQGHNDGLPRFENIQQLKEVIKNNKYDDLNKEIAMDTVQQESLKMATASEYSRTNTQVENVDEADVVKTDGEYIYYVANQKVYIIKANELKIISEIKVDEKKLKFYPREIFINNNKLVVLGTKNEYEEEITNYTETINTKVSYDIARISSSHTSSAIVYDISNKEKPEKVREVELDGNYINSRMINDNIYFISSKSAYYNEQLKDEEITPLVKDTASQVEEKRINCEDIIYFKGTDSYSYMLVAGFNINNNTQASIETFFGANDNIYASEKNLYIAQTRYGDYIDSKLETTIYKFNLTNSQIALQCKSEIVGSINNQFSMDEYEGNLRVATTNGYNENAENQLYILDENLNQIGKIENLAKGERIYSVRFMGKTGYIVTFEQIDPLFVIDLSDPKNPTVKGELKIPGYSSYMHPYDENHIIGIGYNTKSNGYGGVVNTNMKMSMFDVLDMENPKEMFNISIGEKEYTSSDIMYNHKSLFYNKNKNLIGFPLSTRAKGSNNKYGFVIYKIDLENGFEKYGEIFNDTSDFMKNIERVIYIEDTLYTLSSKQIQAYDLIQMNKVSELNLE